MQFFSATPLEIPLATILEIGLFQTILMECILEILLIIVLKIYQTNSTEIPLTCLAISLEI